MARRPRKLTVNTYFHVINRAAGKATLFAKTRDYREFLAVLREGLERYPVPIVAYCILANHWHFVIGPAGTQILTKLMHWVSTTHAVRFRRRHKTVGEGPVYQGRFKSKDISDAQTLIQTCRYVERNALSAGIVRRAQDWPWGSLADRRQSEPSIPLKSAEYLASNAWLDYVNQAVTPKELLKSKRPVPKRPKTVENTPVPKTSRSVENTPVPNSA